jgi:hypothetical protein
MRQSDRTVYTTSNNGAIALQKLYPKRDRFHPSIAWAIAPLPIINTLIQEKSHESNKQYSNN